MKLEFESIEEVKEFVTKLKGTRGGKADKDDETAGTGAAPAPLAPPTGGPGFPGLGGVQFAAPATSAGPGAGAFPAAGATGPAPEVLALVTRINTRIDGAVASGQPADQVLQWFRSQCGQEAASATMDQIKTVFLPKAAMPTLENIARLMNA